MAQSVRLSDSLVNQAKSTGAVMSRSGAGQIVHLAKIGKIAEKIQILPMNSSKTVCLQKRK